MKEYKNISLKDRNTFGIDVSCRRLVEFGGVADLRALFDEGLFAAERWTVLSGGSNIIFTSDFDGVLLHPVEDKVGVIGGSGDGVLVRVAAGMDWGRFVEWCVDEGLWGVENLAGIPGLAGASPVQNIGAYGVEVKDTVHSVEVFAVGSGEELTIACGDCGFGYRDSVFKRSLKGKVVVTAVNFTLSRTPCPVLGYGDLREKVEAMGGPTLANIRRSVIAIRDSKLPNPAVTGNAGSFFKNPVVPEPVALALKADYPDMPVYPAQQEGYAKLAAGWLIDRCGWKGRSHGCVGVHERQALVLVNLGGAAGRDVVELAGSIQADVLGKFGVEIETEVNVI